MKFCSGGMLTATKVKMSDREKRVNKNTSDIPAIKRVTSKFLEVSRNSRGKQRQRNVQKKCAASAKLLFCLIDLLLYFYRSRCLQRSALTILYFFLSKL